MYRGWLLPSLVIKKVTRVDEYLLLFLSLFIPDWLILLSQTDSQYSTVCTYIRAGSTCRLVWQTYGHTYTEHYIRNSRKPPQYISDGQFRDWSPWTACSSTCSPSVRTRRRFCDQPLLGGVNNCDLTLNRETEECSVAVDCVTGTMLLISLRITRLKVVP